MKELLDLTVPQLRELQKQVGPGWRYDEIERAIAAQLAGQRAITVATAEVGSGVPLADGTPLKLREPNKWEAQFMAEQRARDDVAEVRFEQIRLRLADGTWYKPDVFVLRKDGRIELIEVKGFARTAAIVRFKVAREQHPWFLIRMYRKRRKKHGGGWQELYPYAVKE